MSNRTDVHSPKSLVTEDYEFFACIDYGGSEPDPVAQNYKFDMVQLFLSQGYRFASVHGAGQCDHCGTRIRYAAWMKHPKTMKIVEIGETCLDNRFDRATADFQKMRKAAVLDRQKQRIKGLVAEFVTANPDLAWMASKDSADIPEASQDNWFVSDVAHKLRIYGELSDRQVEAVRGAVERDATRKAERDAEALEPKGPVPAGTKVDIEGTVVGRKYQESMYGGAWKITVKLANGSKIWFTEPSRVEVKRGDEIKCRLSQVTAADDNESFGFGKRPTRFEVKEMAEA